MEYQVYLNTFQVPRKILKFTYRLYIKEYIKEILVVKYQNSAETLRRSIPHSKPYYLLDNYTKNTPEGTRETSSSVTQIS